MQSDLTFQLAGAPKEYDYFQLLHLAEIQLRKQLGEDGVGQEALDLLSKYLRVTTRNSLGFAPQDVHSCEMSENNVIEMSVNFMGLYGASSPLPSYFTDPLDRMDERYEGLRKFLDIFASRIYLLYYLAWRRSRLSVMLETKGKERLLQNLANWMGRGGSASHMGFRRLARAAQFSMRSRSAESLAMLLRAELGTPAVKIVQFVTQTVINESPLRLGVSKLGGGLLGETVDVSDQCFRVEIGPLAWKMFRNYLPGGNMPHLADMIGYFLRDPLFYAVRVSLDPTSVPTSEGNLLNGETMLGQKSWLGTVDREVIEIEL